MQLFRVLTTFSLVTSIGEPQKSRAEGHLKRKIQGFEGVFK